MIAAAWNQIFPDEKAAKTGNGAFDRCMERLGYGDEATSRAVCMQAVTETATEVDCHVEWDGRANPTVCE